MIEDFRGRVEIVPGKAIFSRKAPDGRRKCRIVVCGNFVSNDGTITNSAEVQEKKKKKDPDLYAGGADAIALRSALSIASRHRWQAASLDVKTAFLNADFNEGARPKEHEEERLVMMQPPRIMVKMGFCAEGELWVIDRAMYGLRESPRSWSSYRDTAMMTFEDSFFMRLEVADEEQRTKKRKVVRCVTEENLWQIVEVHDLDTAHESQVLLGLVLVYVDDFLILGSKDSIRWFDKKLREKWEATALEWANPREALRFLGMDIYPNDDGTFHANQRSYIKELGKRYGMENEKQAVPIKDVTEPEEEEGRTLEQVREAQKIAGEIQCVATKTRLDIMFAVAKVGSATAKSPVWAKEIGLGILRYLVSTQTLGIEFKAWEYLRQGATQLSREVEVWTDASFAPAGGVSHGCSLFLWAGCPVAWSSTKQPFPALSTAEAELIALLEGVTMGECVSCIFEEIAGQQHRALYCDNTAAISLATQRGGSWRTRHLKVRAAHLKWKLDTVQWHLDHCIGELMLADIGTKALKPYRLAMLAEKIGLHPCYEEVDHALEVREQQHRAEDEKSQTEGRGESLSLRQLRFEDDMRSVAKLISLIAVLQPVQAAMAAVEPVEGSESYVAMVSFGMVMMVLGAVVLRLLQRWNYDRELPQAKEMPVVAKMKVKGNPVVTEEPNYQDGGRSRRTRSSSPRGVEDQELREEGDDVSAGAVAAPPSVASFVSAASAATSAARTTASSTLRARRQRTQGPVITQHGKKFHRSLRCSTLKRSGAGRRSLCDSCTDGYDEASQVLLDEGGIVHLDVRCPKGQGRLETLPQCTVCPD